MAEFYMRLRKLMADTGIGTESLAKLLNISVQYADNLVTGYNSPTIGIMTRIAQIFNVSEGYIAGTSDEAKVQENPFVKEIYVVGNINKNDGIITKENVIGTEYMNREDMHGMEHFAMFVKDDSLVKARIFKGDELIVRQQNTANNGDMVVAIAGDEEAVVRRYNRVGNIVTLTAEGDMMKYKTVKIDTSETRLLILGKVCEVRFKEI